MRDCEYLIVGAGSAGCVLAARLSEDPSVNVVLLEAGGSDRSIIVQMPSALSMPMNTRRFNWGFQTEAEPSNQNLRSKTIGFAIVLLSVCLFYFGTHGHIPTARSGPSLAAAVPAPPPPHPFTSYPTARAP